MRILARTALALVGLAAPACTFSPQASCRAGAAGARDFSSTAVATAVATATRSVDSQPEQMLARGIELGLHRGDFPLSRVVGQEEIKTALLLAAVNPRMGGVIISGGHGTAKSIMARALQRIMPPIEVVKGSPYNVDPAAPGDVDTLLAEELAASETLLGDLPTEIVPCPFVQVPLNVMEDRLLGSVNLEMSVEQGRSVFQPGLLAKAHRGILFVDDVNLLDSELVNVLMGVLSDGWVQVEREGVSLRYPCRPLVVATFNPEEAELRDHLLDRIAVALSADAKGLTVEQRLEAVGEVLEWTRTSRRSLSDPAAVERKTSDAMSDSPSGALSDAEQEDQLRTRIVFAREALKTTALAPEQMRYLSEEAARAGCQGHRGDIFACEVARASAALNDRRVEADDLRIAVKLAILPRGTFVTTPESPDDLLPPPPPPPPPQQQQANKDEGDEKENDEEDKDEPDEKEDDKDDNAEQEDDQPQVPQEFMFDAVGTPIDPTLLAFAKKQKSGKGGGRGLVFSWDRGRYIKPMLPRGGRKVKRLALDATMRAAAPYQKGRRERNAAKPEGQRSQNAVFIQEGDIRVKRMARKAGSLVIFVCDASGSMALNRMNAAKGAAMSLLAEAYKKRDKVCIVPFQGDAAVVLLPPTKSTALAKRCLETMPCGGGSPLAHALQVAARAGLGSQKAGDTSKVVMIVLSDGRANVPLSYASDAGPDDPERVKSDRAACKEEVLRVAASMRGMRGFNVVVLDTENKFVSTGMAKELAKAAGGRYHYIPKAGDRQIANLAKQAMDDARG